MSRIPLENHALERAVLGSLLGDTNMFWQLKDRAREELFTVVTHGRIVRIMHQLVEEGRELSVPAVITRLGREDDSNFSPEGYLATLLADEADPDQLTDHFRDLEDMWARRKMAKLGQELIKQSTEDNGLDAMGRLEKAREDIDSMGDPMGTTVQHISTIAQNLINRVSAASDREEAVGLPVGLKNVQDLTGPLMPKRLYTIAGPPGSGKTALAYQIAAFIAQEQPVLFEEIEMGEEEMVERDLAGRTGIGADKIERAALNSDEIDLLFDEALKLADLKLYIDGSTGITVAQIRAKAMRMKRLKGLSGVFVDHLLYIQPPSTGKRDGGNEFAGIRANMQALKKMAKDLEIPVVVLAQLKKEFGEGPWNMMRRPNVNDLYGGSAVEQESDVVLFVHREEYLLGRKEPAQDAKDRAEWQLKMDNVRGKAELVLGKRRGGTGFGVRTLYFEGPRVRFSDQAPRTSIDFSKLNRPGQGSLLSEDDVAAMREM